MTKYLFITLFFFGLFSVNMTNSLTKMNSSQLHTNVQGYKNYGKKINPDNSLTATEMKQRYAGLKVGDTIAVKFTTTVKSVCKMKGCWMTLELPQTEEDPMIKFKDYSFFVPKDVEGKEVIVEGVAFIEETSIADLKHFAEDAGKTAKEISEIVTPKKSMSFIADGVLIKE